MTTLGPIACVTLATPDVQRLVDAYGLYLGHQLIDHGRISPRLARLWARPPARRPSLRDDVAAR